MRTTIFFDIDGVLSTSAEVVSGDYHYYESANSSVDLKFYPLKKSAVHYFQKILEQFEVDIVLSSSWRFAPFANAMDILTKNGMTPKTWKYVQRSLPVTPVHIKNRWEAIRTYTRNHGCRPVILDDLEPPKGFIENFLDTHEGFFIQCYEPLGLAQAETYAALVRILTHCQAREDGVY